MADTKWSQFPSQTPVNADEVVGLHSGDNARFSISNIVAAVRNGLASIFVPLTRTINGKGLSTDISLDSSDIDYDNTQSGLTATDVQEAIDELAQGGGGGGSGASEAQLGYPESGTTASRNYSAGEYICWNGLTYTANQAISSGATLNAGAGGNLTECVGGGLNATRPKQVTGITINSTYVDDSLAGYTPTCVISNGIATLGGAVNVKSNVPAGQVLAEVFPTPKDPNAFIAAYNSNTGTPTLVRVVGGNNATTGKMLSVYSLTKQSGITVYYLVGSYEIAEGG